MMPLRFTALVVLATAFLGCHSASRSHSRGEEDRELSAPIFTSFESAPSGPLLEGRCDGIVWRAAPGHAAINSTEPKSGRHCLQLLGGDHSEVIFELEKERTEVVDTLIFAAERWTARPPFRFRVAVEVEGGGWREVYNGDTSVAVGRRYRSQVTVPVPLGSRRFRFQCLSPAKTGVLIDDLSLVELGPMELASVEPSRRAFPVLIGQRPSPLLELKVETRGSHSPLMLRSATFVIDEGYAAIERLQFGGVSLSGGSREYVIPVEVVLKPGTQFLPLTCELSSSADLDGAVRARCARVQIGDRIVELDDDFGVRRKIGVAVRRRGEESVHTYRIPGITETNEGTLIAVYDHRYRSAVDLPGDVDVGMSRSTDGGRTWTPSRVILDMGNDPRWNYDGVGDPAILTDRVTGTVWVAATWSHGDRSWQGSGPGLEPDETGQLLLVKSEDDGLTWSKPMNITRQVKRDPNWRFVLQGPGNGITLTDGTLVFPAQYRGVDADPVNGKPYSTILVSRDQGKSWKIGTGVKIDTTEAQVVQLGDGSIMINCRDNRGGARSVYTTRDLGETWEVHPTSRAALPEPVCNAGLIRVVHPEFGAALLFSNPNTTRGRERFTLKVSRDEGETWPDQWHTLYDERRGYGYSVLTPVGPDHVGVFWEGEGELYFLRFSYAELLGESDR
ncbi:MAG: sialidase family protein [Planctomycetota bacterium]